MDVRFVRAWERIEERRGRGEALDRVLSTSSSGDLVAALAGLGAEEPVVANAIATEILNRLHRARFLGGSIVLLVTGMALFPIAAMLAGSMGWLERSLMVLSFLPLLAGLVGLVATLVWSRQRQRMLVGAAALALVSVVAIPTGALLSGSWGPQALALAFVSLLSFTSALVLFALYRGRKSVDPARQG